MSENPFDQLGLKKELVQYLHQSGQIGEFLRDYSRALQVRLHPDKGGNKDLSALVNGAVSELRTHPESISAWLQSMRNGHHPEYESVIEGLVAEVERLRKIEAEKEVLAGKYARLLASQAGKTDASRVRTASPRARRVPEAEPEEIDLERDDTEEAEAIPKVKRPSARRVPAEEPAARKERRDARAGRRESIDLAEPIILENIVLYDAEGKPAITYKKVALDGEAVKDSREYLTNSQDGWIKYFSSSGRGRVLPSLPLYYAIIERLQETKHPAAGGLLKDLKDSWLCTSTRIDYKKNHITHGYGFEPYALSCPLPEGNVWLDEVKGKKGWQAALQALLMPKELDQAIGRMQEFSGKRSYIWTPDAESRREYPSRAVWLYVGLERLLLGVGCHPDVVNGRSRGVRSEK